ncbi:Uncharacterized protein BM_BM1622 [Brugia malayi]|uniref:Bm1622 n=1 Tax=Brugia malayi TaxID=6279 RepID=A0A0J9Y4C6_BRUMA|nr:Uncharacterized protein BM_BM1622 [Brugia malayi]CDQ02072.1 Bm1622 [Brugia malayi]VIO96174.1 Uncharacterized protein BM_BM1622 [Brugia malayi]
MCCTTKRLLIWLNLLPSSLFRKAPYDHSGNDLRQLGETITNAISNAPDKSCAWNLLKLLSIT